VRFAEEAAEEDADWRAEEVDHLRGAEDEFLKMAEMERFVRQAEEGPAARALGGDDSDEEAGEDELGDDELDLLYGAGPDDGGSGEEEGWESESDGEAKELTYRDFFGGSAAADDSASMSGSEEEEEEGGELGARAGRAAGRGRSGGEESEGDEDDGDTREPPGTVQGLRRHRMEDRIAKLEERNMAEREWALRGEVKSGDRPFNSLLEAELDYERVLRPAPVATEETTNALEAMIAARIQEGRFDDPVQITEDQLSKEGAHKAGEGEEEALDDRRSKKGLGEEYADAYVKQKGGGAAGPAEQEAARAECWDLFRKINAELDSLANLDFTPTPAATEQAAAALRKPGDAAALALEEVGAEAGTGASAKAPEDLLRSKAGGAPVAEGELDHSDRRTRRRKLKQKTRNSQQAKRNEAPEGGRSKRKSVAAEVEKAKAGARKRSKKGGAKVEVEAAKATKFGRSTEVFSKLQEMRSAGAGAARGPGAADAPGAARRTAKSLKL